MVSIFTTIWRWVSTLLPQKFALAIFFWNQPTSMGLQRVWGRLEPHDPIVKDDNKNKSRSKDERPTYSIKVLQYNTQQLIHFADSTKITAIAQDLAKGEYDVICLNEVFHENSRAILTKELQASGLYTAAVTRAGREKWFGLGEDSGLFMVSKFPIHGSMFYQYKTQAVVADVLANKGVLMFTLVMPDETKIGFAMTHTQAQVEGAEVRLKQIQECMELFQVGDTVHRLLGHDKPTLVFLGDLNITDVSGAERAGMTNPYTQTVEYPTMVAEIKKAFPEAMDLYRHHHPDPEKEPGYTFDAIENTYDAFDANRGKMLRREIPPEQERLDYIWVLRSRGHNRILDCVACDIDRRNDKSDHWGLYAHFLLRPCEESEEEWTSEPAIVEKAKKMLGVADMGVSFMQRGPSRQELDQSKKSQ